MAKRALLRKELPDDFPDMLWLMVAKTRMEAARIETPELCLLYFVWEKQMPCLGVKQCNPIHIWIPESTEPVIMEGRRTLPPGSLIRG